MMRGKRLPKEKRKCALEGHWVHKDIKPKRPGPCSDSLTILLKPKKRRDPLLHVSVRTPQKAIQETSHGVGVGGTTHSLLTLNITNEKQKPL